MLKKLLYTFVLLMPSTSYANEPKDWQLGFQKSASKSMTDIVWFHDYMLLPIITGITLFFISFFTKLTGENNDLVIHNFYFFCFNIDGINVCLTVVVFVHKAVIFPRYFITSV